MPGVDNFPGRLQTVKPQTTLQAFCKGDDPFCLAVSNQAADFFARNGEDTTHQLSRTLGSIDFHTEFRT